MSVEKNATISSEQKVSFWTRDFISLALINFMMVIGFNMTTVGMPVYVSHLGGSDVLVGLVTTLATGAALVVRPFVGFMLDRFGRKGILITGIAMMTLVIIFYAIFPLVSLILALRMVQGIGWALSSTSSTTIAADIIPRKRFAEGMGYFALTSSIAVAFAPALSIALVQSTGPLPMLVIAGSCSAIALICAFLQRTKKIEAPKRKKIRLSSFFDKRALLPAVIMFFISLAFASITTFIVLHGQSRGVGNIFLYFIVYAIVTIISRPIIGRAIDKKGFFYPGLLSTISMMVTLVLISLADNIVAFCVAGIFAGLGIGAGMGTLQAMAIAAVPPERRGVATSTFMFGWDAGISSGAVIAGVLATSFGYGSMYLLVAIFPAIACAIFIIVGKKRIARYSQTDFEEVSS